MKSRWDLSLKQPCVKLCIESRTPAGGKLQSGTLAMPLPSCVAVGGPTFGLQGMAGCADAKVTGTAHGSGEQSKLAQAEA